MSHIDIYTNKAAVETLLQVIKIAQQAHQLNPSPVEIKLQLSAIDETMLNELAANFEDLLKATKQIDNYWRCNCTGKNIHLRNKLTYCEHCDLHSMEAPNATPEEVEEIINDANTK